MLSTDTDQNSKKSGRSENEEDRKPSPHYHTVTAEMYSLGDL